MHFHSRKCTWKCRMWNGIHFVLASMWWATAPCPLYHGYHQRKHTVWCFFRCDCLAFDNIYGNKHIFIVIVINIYQSYVQSSDPNPYVQIRQLFCLNNMLREGWEIKFISLFGDRGHWVHIVHISCVIITFNNMLRSMNFWSCGQELFPFIVHQTKYRS